MSSITIYNGSEKRAGSSSDLDTYITHCYDLMSKEESALSEMEAEELCVCSKFS